MIPRVLGGRSDLGNLALACPSCNLHKADRIRASQGTDSATVALFNLKTDVWINHFEWDDYMLVGCWCLCSWLSLLLVASEPEATVCRPVELEGKVGTFAIPTSAHLLQIV